MTPTDKQLVDKIVKFGYLLKDHAWAFNHLIAYQLFSEPPEGPIRHRKKRRWLSR